MKKLAVVPAIALFLAAGQAVAEPTQKELEERKAALDTKLKGQGFSVVIEAPFVVVGDEGPQMVKHRATGFLRWTVTLLEKDYFKKRPDKLIEVWLFGNEKTYRAGAKKFFNDEPSTPYGYYSPSADALIMNIGPGAGTLSHELVHPYIEANFPNAPAWFNEGLASLYERPIEKAGHIWGLPNWRLPNLRKQINDKKLPSLPTMLGTSRSEFYNANFDSYAYARYLLLYLQEKGKLNDFYQKFVVEKKDLTGQTTIEAVLGQDVATFEPIWRKWVLALQTDGH